jgi:SAM-dependent methyltransferase
MPPARDPASFDDLYTGIPLWDVGRAQEEFVALADRGQIVPPVLDVGCGTGENILEMAERGFEAAGIDAAPRAIGKAIDKARERGLDVRFLVADALALATLGRRFRTVIDSGLFHVFDDEERAVFAASVADVLEPGGRYHLLCFSEHVPGEWGPRRVTQDEIRRTFDRGWRIAEIVETRFETTLPDGAVRAWRATIERLPEAEGRD